MDLCGCLTKFIININVKNMTNIDLKNLREDLRDELLAINNYQIHIDSTDNEDIKELLSHIRDEEKEHVAEITKLLRKLDARQNEVFEKEGV